MKPLLAIALSAWCLIDSATAAGTAAVDLGVFFKVATYEQVGADRATLQEAGFAAIVAPSYPGPNLTMTLIRPTGSEQLRSSEGLFIGAAVYSSVAALDAAYPDGTYTLRVAGGASGNGDVSLRLAGPMPDPILVQNFAAAQAIPNATPFTLEWAAVPGATERDMIQLRIESVDGSYSYDSGSVGEPGVLSGTATKSPVLMLPSDRSFTASLTFAKFTEGDAREIHLVPLVFAGVMAETDFAMATVAPAPDPVILTQPTSIHVADGWSAEFDTSATLIGDYPHYQWYRDGVAIPGATNASLVFAPARTTDMGFYWATVRGDRAREVRTQAAVLAVSGSGSSRLCNLSARVAVPAAGEVFAGFSVQGQGDKHVLLRGVGPQLRTFGLQGISDPYLRVYRFGEDTPLSTNDDWDGSADLRNTFDAVGAFRLAADTKSAALALPLGCDGVQLFTMRVTDVRGGTGAAIAEIYDCDGADCPTRLVNLSTRGWVGTKDDVLICGFVIDGTAPAHVLVRAVGPGLRSFGVLDAIADPRFSVVPLRESYPIATNDDWDGSKTLTDLFDSVGAFRLRNGSKDAAVDLWLPPGGYTITVSGVGNTTGSAIAEIYDLAR